MKICKNCGQQTDDGKVRCPYCGFLFEEDMDDVLREMKSTLKNYRREEIARSSPQSADAPPSPPVQETPVRESAGGPRERFELLSEVAQLKGEVRVLQGEVERLHGTRQQGVQPLPASYIAPPVQEGVYAPQRSAARQEPALTHVRRSGRRRSVNRIVISFLCTLLLALSIAMFSLVWVSGGLDDFGGVMRGYQGILYLFDKTDSGVRGFAGVLSVIGEHSYASSELINGMCVNVCRFVVQWGIPAYAVCLVLSLPILFSLGGKIQFRAWHRCWAWLSFLMILAVFAVLCWTFGLASLTLMFLFGAGANFVRAMCLCFYKRDRFYDGGLQ